MPMTEALLRVVFAGPHVTLQDGGRPGQMRFGVPASGPMDRKALRIANTALGNPPDATGIEVSPGGLVLDCLSGAVTLAMVGGGFILHIDGRKLGSWSVFTLRAGQRLTVRLGPWGSWACLAVAGHLISETWLGSTATHGLSGLGGGRLVAGRVLRVTGPSQCETAERSIPCPVWTRPRHLLHAVWGPQERFFPPEVRTRLATGTFLVSSAIDRMGLRLDGPSLPPEESLGIPSEPILRGSVQVAGDGRPMILLSDHQTTGGYPKIATLLADDVDGLVQCRPGDPLRFRLITPEEAVQIARQRARAVDQYLSALARPYLPTNSNE
ncbi:allophanate hydrolase [Fuscovulum blasticum DSM 2131]|uniref:Allophanate hydrolase n=2 Tax=Fuscovulum blasticum TaxID=1075 RepID=A0A2T4JFH3_FUSBL|nr:allophanate hydrolase [Fuscovulum blasticum DSM 2131]